MSEFIRSLDDIVGHKYIINYLKSKLEKDNVPNVILFNGNPGLGKTSIAKVLAININDNKEEYYLNVIDNNESTDCIKLFNMSSLGDDVDDVVSELQSTSFSSTGKKVIILDEVHGMTKKAQDAILVNLEYLPEGIYVFMCTTEMSMLRESLISRCITFNLNNLSYNDIITVINRKISSLGLRFDLPKSMVLNLIATWANNQPRKALNLLENLDNTKVITKDDLSAFISTNNVPIILSIVEYMYGSLSRGINFIENISITDDLLYTMIDVLKVSLGFTSPLVNSEDKLFLSNFFINNDIDNFLRFVVKVNSNNRISKRVFLSIFIEHHISILNKGVRNFSVEEDKHKAELNDIKTMNAFDNSSININTTIDFSPEEKDSFSVDELFKMGSTVND